MQDFRRVEAQQVADRRDGGSQDDEDDEDGDEADDDGHEGNGGAKNHVADRLREGEASAVADGAAHQADDDRLRQEQRDNLLILGAHGLHEADFAGALHDARGHQVRDGQGRGNERQDGHEDHEQLGLLQDRAFGLGDLADRAGHGVRHDFLDLVGDRGDVGGAVPGFLLGHAQRVRVLRGLAGQVVVGRGQGGDLDAADDALAVQERLGLRKLDEHAAVGVVAAGEDAAHRELARDSLAGKGEGVADAEAVGGRVGGANKGAALVVVRGPGALDAPPAAQLVEAGFDALAGGQLEVVAEPGAGRGHVLAAPVRDGHAQQGREVEDVVGPEDRLNVAELVLAQVGTGLGCLARGVEVVEDGRALGAHDDVRAVGLEFLVDFVAHVEHDGEHGRGNAGT